MRLVRRPRPKPERNPDVCRLVIEMDPALRHRFRLACLYSKQDMSEIVRSFIIRYIEARPR